MTVTPQFTVKWLIEEINFLDVNVRLIDGHVEPEKPNDTHH